MCELEQAVLVKRHAVFRAFTSSPFENSPFSSTLRLKHKFGDELPPIDGIFEEIFITVKPGK